MQSINERVDRSTATPPNAGSGNKPVRGQLSLLATAIAIVLALAPIVTTVVEYLAPRVELLAARYAAGTGTADRPFAGFAAGAGREGTPAAEMPFDPAFGPSFSQSLGGEYEYVTELPPTLLYIDEATAELAQGSTALELSNRSAHELFLDFRYRPELTLAWSAPLGRLKRQLATSEQSERHLAELATIVEAELEGPGYRISPEEPIRRTIAEQNELAWEWRVEPLREGEQPLTATITALFRVSGVEYAERVAVVEKRFRIVRSPWAPARRFFDTTGKWIVAALVLPLAGWIIRKHAAEHRSPEVSEQ